MPPTLLQELEAQQADLATKLDAARRSAAADAQAAAQPRAGLAIIIDIVHVLASLAGNNPKLEGLIKEFEAAGAALIGR